jgi:hypothetical protein
LTAILSCYELNCSYLLKIRVGFLSKIGGYSTFSLSSASDSGFRLYFLILANGLASSGYCGYWIDGKKLSIEGGTAR